MKCYEKECGGKIIKKDVIMYGVRCVGPVVPLVANPCCGCGRLYSKRRPVFDGKGRRAFYENGRPIFKGEPARHKITPD